MGNRLYVGNLSYHTTAQDLKEGFGFCGKVLDARVVVDRETGQNRGFGFVEFETEAEATKAIQEFDGQEFDGRPLRVRVAEPKPQGQGGYQGRPAPSFKPQSQNYGSAPQAPSSEFAPRKKKRGGRRRDREEADWD